MIARTFKMLALTAACITLLLAAMDSTASAAGREVVKFRLTKWKSLHFTDAKKAATHHAVVKKLGCETREHKHDDHYDVSYRCPKWLELSLASHADAHKWERWLKSVGFETQHEH